MNDDAELLRRYAEDASESAFGELVARHIDLVYSAALRVVGGDTHLAQDVAQTVFADLARKARALSRHEVLTGWLYQATRFAAAKAVRTERRRSSREKEAVAMQELSSDANWERLRPRRGCSQFNLQPPESYEHDQIESRTPEPCGRCRSRNSDRGSTTIPLPAARGEPGAARTIAGA